MTTLGVAVLAAPYATAMSAQDEASPKAVLLGRARALEGRGRLDLAKQDWLQVLQLDPKDAEALGGMVRASRAAGQSAEADGYQARLRAVTPAQAATTLKAATGAAADPGAELADAARLQRAGDAAGAMALYRRVYGANPPAGQPALAYFETEAATEGGRPHAIAGLRALVDRFPADPRYQIALGRILLSSVRTRAEGRTLLERFPGITEAVAALHGMVGTSTAPVQVAAGAAPAGSAAAPGARPATAARTTSLAASATKHSEAASAGASVSQVARAKSRPAAPQSTTANENGGGHLSLASDDQAAFSALNAHRLAEAEQRFQAILAANPNDARALAGMGYLRVTTGDLKAAVGYFQLAQEKGDRSLALTRAMISAQFEVALRMASAQRSRGDLGGAEARYREALRERPSDPEALDGLAQTLLQQNRAAEAATVYHRLTEVRPLNPAAWRGLVVAEADSGRGAAALATDARIPAAVKAPLLQDATYQITLASVRGAQPAQIARTEAPAIVVARPAPVARAQPAPAPARVSPPITHTPVVSSVVESKVALPPRHKEADTKAASLAKAGPPAKATVAPVLTAAAPLAPSPATVAANNEAIANERLQQADLALMHGANAEATVLFHDVLSRTPDRPEAWRGLVVSLQRNGREREAASALERMPMPVQAALAKDASFQSAAGAVYLANDRPREALGALARAQEVFAAQRLTPPLELVMQTARLLSARADDENLYRELMYLGERRDLNDVQRAQVQMIWTQWAVRRARALNAAGDDRRAVVLLNAAAVAFAGNAAVLRAVASGYAGIGKPREAVALYKTQDLVNAPVQVLEAATEAATAARDFRTAESWAHLGLSRFGQDPGMLTSVAELEQARGHEKRADQLTQQAKAVAPAQDPGQVLAMELREAKAGAGWSERPGRAGQLSTLLAPTDAAAAGSSAGGRPYLPGAAGAADASVAAAAAPVLAGYEQPSL